ncbi:phenazine biosynthesis protein PhzF family [Pseudoxanthomonas sp. GM95]|uniref:PhzF family phenazine biosynthesis protein n=1 Tax=Pseudoxanthomonas sp. GM95 TaxID=1881043 RepID=UPI0008D5839F|nr:PhzF family phenazine biosynthesis protein [Pseudoxanthomonas sp. GM95]SEL77816.1 phenazine biosynthesis protein PhzF family [Pseudoxanthomonas sp. GM95]
MTQRRYLQLDVFAHAPGTGNPLGVVVDAHGLDSAAMQALAAWLNLSETIFFLPVGGHGADYHIRIFTPKGELPFAGHPSVGAAWAALEMGLVRPEHRQPDASGRTALVQQCAAGMLPVQVKQADGVRLVDVRTPRAVHRRDVPAPDWLLAPSVFGAARGALPPALHNNGPDWWLLELADEAALRALQPDQALIAALPGNGKLAVFARSHGGEHDLAVRAFAPGVGVAEDPVTGSANGSIGAYLAANDALPGRDGRYVASQGRELGRDGRVLVQVDDARDVWIGGQVQPVIQGQIAW